LTQVGIVFAALAVSQWVETATGWSIKKFVTTARRYRTTGIRLGDLTLPAVEKLPDGLQQALTKINEAARRRGRHFCPSQALEQTEMTRSHPLARKSECGSPHDLPSGLMTWPTGGHQKPGPPKALSRKMPTI
jgi:hypothetical protein